MRLVPTSLFGRMLALSLLATALALVVAGFAIGGVLERFVTSGIDMRLNDRLAAIEATVRPDGSLDRALLNRVTARIPPDEPWRIAIARTSLGNGTDLIADDRPRPRRRGPNDDQVASPFEGYVRGGARVHGLSSTIDTDAGPARVLVAVSRDKIDRPVLAALAPLAASLAILGLALGGAALLQLRLGLRPLHRLRTAVEDVRRGRASSVPEDVPDELAPLARELNAFAVDTGSALSGARASAANLAHALKTPVATLGLHLSGDPVASAQLARIDATLRHHLGRARANAVDRRAATRLAPVLADLASAIAALHGQRVAIRLEVPDDLVAAVGAQDLDEIAGNLIDNAVRHAAATVSVTATPSDREIVLSIADDGPGIATVDRDKATAPGVRLDERGDGHGFGLAIARELGELYGGALTLHDAPGGGLLAQVTLPRAIAFASRTARADRAGPDDEG